MPLFTRYIGIDYSGAETPMSSLPGLRVYEATPDQPPSAVLESPQPAQALDTPRHRRMAGD